MTRFQAVCKLLTNILIKSDKIPGAHHSSNSILFINSRSKTYTGHLLLDVPLILMSSSVDVHNVLLQLTQAEST